MTDEQELRRWAIEVAARTNPVDPVGLAAKIVEFVAPAVASVVAPVARRVGKHISVEQSQIIRSMYEIEADNTKIMAAVNAVGDKLSWKQIGFHAGYLGLHRPPGGSSRAAAAMLEARLRNLAARRNGTAP